MTFYNWCAHYGGATQPSVDRAVHRFCCDLVFDQGRPMTPKRRWRDQTLKWSEDQLARYLDCIIRWAGPKGHSEDTVRKAWNAWRESINH